MKVIIKKIVIFFTFICFLHEINYLSKAYSKNLISITKSTLQLKKLSLQSKLVKNTPKKFVLQ